MTMNIPRDYRFKQNPDEKEIVEYFINKYGNLGTRNGLRKFTDVALTEKMRENGYYLTEREEMIILNTIQWLKSPVGKFFMKEVEQQIEEKKY